MILYDRFRHNLQRAIDADKRSIEQIAVRAGFSSSHVRHVLQGDKRNPTLQFVERITQALGYEPLDLLRSPTHD